MSWELAAWLLLGGSTVLIFLGLPVAFGFLVINLVGAWLYLGGEPGLVQLARLIDCEGQRPPPSGEGD
jgi:hypothetical protein